MEAQEDVVGVRDLGGGLCSSSEGLEQQVSSSRESESLEAVVVDQMDSFLEDFDDQLAISRMVSDSVTKGMVRALEQMAEEKITAKELEVASLKEAMHFPQLGDDKNESSGSSLAYQEPFSKENGLCHSFADALVEHDRMGESLGILRNVARGQITKLKREIDSIRGCSPMRRISSGSELVGLGEILQEQASESLVGLDKRLDTLKTTLDNLCARVDNMVHLSKVSICEWQQEQEFQRELEAMVIQSLIRSLHEEFEEKLWGQNTNLCGSQSLNFLEKFNEVSNLRKELDVILKSLSSPEIGQLISHASHDVDHFHRKALNNHVSPSTSLWEGNGIFEESKNGMPETWDVAQLKHMKSEQLVSYFNNMITGLKRNHELKVQMMTEDYFSLKREYLKEKGSSLPLRKDKELDLLRKKIPEIILKLDDILLENKKISTLSNSTETLDSLKDRLNSLLLENHQLRDSLSDKRKEVKCLSSQVSDAAEKMLQNSLAQANLLKMMGNLKSNLEDAEIKSSVAEEAQINSEELAMQSIVMKDIYEILYREAAHCAQASSKCENEDSDINLLVMQALCGVVFTEVIRDAQSQINNLNTKYLQENEIRVSLELKEREQSKLASQEIKILKDNISSLQMSMTEGSKALDLMKAELAGALQKIEVDKVEMKKLNENLDLRTKELREADKQRNMLIAVCQEKQTDLLLREAKESEQRKQMEAVVVLVRGLSQALSDLECRVTEGIKKNNLRLQESRFQLNSLIQKTNVLKRTALLYKHRLERRNADLQLAEAEVDLLGDEVDAVLGLLEKIYIGLDHYSPILQHYPGIMDILKLVQRELSGESTNAT